MTDKLKDTLFPRKVIDELTSSISKVYPEFKQNDFVNQVYNDKWKDLELKERISHITFCLRKFLPDNFEKAVAIMTQIAKGFRGVVALSFSEYIERYGQDSWEVSMPALALFTKSGTSEFAVRPFLDKEPEKGMQQMLEWSTDENEHIRRFSSEGCRPRLPWGMALKKFKKDPSLILPVLENLKDDPSEYVRKSVANNLNDISKDNPEVVLNICERWQGTSKNTDWIIKHACRTLLKSGNKQAMLLFGFGDPKNIETTNFTSDNLSPKIGEAVQLSFQLHVNEKQKKKIRLEYIVHYIKANGKPSPKVFQIREKVFNPGTHSISIKHDFQERTTRKHYPGKHQFDIIVNGEKKAEFICDLNS